jgi:hypothetical protein
VIGDHGVWSESTAAGQNRDRCCGSLPTAKEVAVLARGPIRKYASSFIVRMSLFTDSAVDFRCASVSDSIKFPSSRLHCGGAFYLALAPNPHPVRAACKTAHSLWTQPPSFSCYPLLVRPTPLNPATITTRTHNAEVSILGDRQDILNRNAVETSPTKEVFRTIIAILPLVRVSALVLHPSANFQ